MRSLSIRSRWVAAVVTSLSLGACVEAEAPGAEEEQGYRELRSALPHDTAPAVAPEDHDRIVDGTASFGLSVFREVARADRNFFYSPLSTTVALGMTYAGARGETATEMGRVLGSAVSQPAFASSMNRLLVDLAAANVAPHATDEGTKSVTLVPANAVWLQDGLELGPEFVDTMSVRYDAGVKLLEIAKEPESAIRTINRWVARTTRDKILNLIPAKAIGSQTPLVLTNALYFYGSWAKSFAPGSTADRPFHSPEGEISVPTMHDVRLVSYGEGDGWQAVDLPYDGNQIAMTVLVPSAGRFAEIRDAITATWLANARSAMKAEGSVKLALPKFRFTWGTESLKSALQALGMVTAFSADADFSAMLPSRRILIEDVFHKAFIGVDEAGTEAAAATAVTTRVVSAPVIAHELTADRPFFVFIHDTKGALLFVGQVTNPAI